MIHYTCDRCKRQIDTEEQPRYVVLIEIQSMADETLVERDDEIDHLNELHQTLEGLNSPIGDEDHELHHRGSYDLCSECHQQFLKNPLGRDVMASIGFSNN